MGRGVFSVNRSGVVSLQLAFVSLCRKKGW